MSKKEERFPQNSKQNWCLKLIKAKKTLTPSPQKIQFSQIYKGTGKMNFWKKHQLYLTVQMMISSRQSLKLKEKTEYAKKVGQLTMQVDWLKKNLRNCSDLNTRLNILQNFSKTKELPVSVGAELLDVNRTSIYYKPKGISERK